ncbi:MAG: TolC family protein [Vicinamibacterales bacterium]|nr:TolC family protein [Vicinamibacterales bacterium]
MIKRFIIFSVLGTALVSASPVSVGAQTGRPASPVATLSYDEALAKLNASNESLKAAAAEVMQRQQERAAVRSLYWPRIDLRAQATHLDDAIVIDLDPIRQVINSLHRLPDSVLPPFESIAQKQNFWLSQVTATWPVYTGGKVQAANRAAALQVEDASHRRTLTADMLATDLVRRYFALRLALKARDVRSAVRDSLDRHVFEARRLEEEGFIARVERLHAEVAQARAVRDLKAAEQDVALARTALASLLSTPEQADPSDELFLLTDIGPIESYVATALLEHPGLKRLATQRGLTSEALRAEQGRWLPDVAVFGTRELHTDDLSLLSPKWAVGVAATFTVFDGFDRQHRIAAARSQRARVDFLDARARRDVSTLVEQKYRTITKAREQFISLDASVTLADEVVRVRSRAFDEGFGTSLEVVDAQLTLQAVKLQRLLAAYEFDVALAELLEAAGEPGRYSDLRRRADLFPER